MIEPLAERLVGRYLVDDVVRPGHRRGAGQPG